MISARRDRDLLEGIGNNLIFSAGLIFQRLELAQFVDDELKEVKQALKRLARDKDQVAASLEFEKVKVTTLTQEKSSTLEEKQSALL